MTPVHCRHLQDECAAPPAAAPCGTGRAPERWARIRACSAPPPRHSTDTRPEPQPPRRRFGVPAYRHKRSAPPVAGGQPVPQDRRGPGVLSPGGHGPQVGLAVDNPVVKFSLGWHRPLGRHGLSRTGVGARRLRTWPPGGTGSAPRPVRASCGPRPPDATGSALAGLESGVPPVNDVGVAAAAHHCGAGLPGQGPD